MVSKRVTILIKVTLGCSKDGTAIIDVDVDVGTVVLGKSSSGREIACAGAGTLESAAGLSPVFGSLATTRLPLGGVVGLRAASGKYLLVRGETPVRVEGDPRGRFSGGIGNLRRGDGHVRGRFSGGIGNLRRGDGHVRLFFNIFANSSVCHLSNRSLSLTTESTLDRHGLQENLDFICVLSTFSSPTTAFSFRHNSVGLASSSHSLYL